MEQSVTVDSNCKNFFQLPEEQTAADYIIKKCGTFQAQHPCIENPISGESIQYAQVGPFSRSVASFLLANGFAPGDVIINVSHDGANLHVFFIGVWLAGGVIQCFYPDDIDTALAGLIVTSKPKYILCDLKDAEACQKALRVSDGKYYPAQVITFGETVSANFISAKKIFQKKNDGFCDEDTHSIRISSLDEEQLQFRLQNQMEIGKAIVTQFATSLQNNYCKKNLEGAFAAKKALTDFRINISVPTYNQMPKTTFIYLAQLKKDFSLNTQLVYADGQRFASELRMLQGMELIWDNLVSCEDSQMDEEMETEGKQTALKYYTAEFFMLAKTTLLKHSKQKEINWNKYNCRTSIPYPNYIKSNSEIPKVFSRYEDSINRNFSEKPFPSPKVIIENFNKAKSQNSARSKTSHNSTNNNAGDIVNTSVAKSPRKTYKSKLPSKMHNKPTSNKQNSDSTSFVANQKVASTSEYHTYQAKGQPQLKMTKIFPERLINTVPNG